MKEIQLPLYEPRDYQLPILHALEDGYKKVIAVVARRAGKDLMAWNYLICQAFTRVGLYWHIYPTYSQGKKCLWDGMTFEGRPFLSFIPPELIAAKNSSEMKITLVNGSIIQVVGSEKIHNLRGTNAVGCVFSEAAYHHPDAYSVIRPVLMANDGWALFITTPFGHNHFYDLWKIAKANPKEWWTTQLSINETKHLSKEQIESEIASGEISRELAQQEYFVSFDTGAATSFWATYINDMRLDGRIASIPYDPLYPVNSVWDLGFSDQTAIILYQVLKEGRINVIDCYESSSQPLEHYIKVLEEKGRNWVWGKHFGPHDLSVHEFQTGMSRAEKARSLGFKFEMKDGKSVTPNMSIAEGIEAVRTTLPRMWIDEIKGAKLIKALENYRKTWDDERKIFSDKPFHDWSSHFADCARYLALNMRSFKDTTSAADLDKRYRQAMYEDRYQQPSLFR